ncbi:MAG: hypothetical protein ACTS73_08880 [Arsenophonus sp. NEOnobi-MAG3]
MISCLIVDEKKGNIDMIEVTLADWLYQPLHKKKMLKINQIIFVSKK